MDGTRHRSRYSIPLQTIIIGMVVIGFIISSLLLFFMVQTSKSYEEMRHSTQGYIDCQKIAGNLLAGSESLTVNARGFIVTGDRHQVDLYYNNNEARNAIESALTEIRAYSLDERVLSQLNNAIQQRKHLISTEEYAMRLKVEASNDDITTYIDKLQAVQLLPADMNLTPQEQDEKARRLLFDIDYESSRNEISLRINRGMEVLMGTMLTRQVESSDHLLYVLHSQQVLTAALMLFLLVLALVIFTIVVAPLQRQISSMSKGLEIREEGASEIRFLARTYNQLHEQNLIAAQKLNYKATHDELTGLYNRSAYDSQISKLKQDNEKTALLLFDVDHFKNFNDQYGHDIGDAILKLIADNLRAVFRKDDMVCRLGGDEFAVIMCHADSSIRPLVSSRLCSIAEKLAAQNNDLPPVTFSAGIAFSDELIPGTDLFKSADLALYQVKNGGRNGFGFASDSGNIETFHQ